MSAMTESSGFFANAMDTLQSFLAPSGGEVRKRPVRLHSDYYRKVADRILGATDATNLADLLDEASGDEQVFEELKAVPAPVQEPHPASIEQATSALNVSRLDAASLSAVLGVTSTARCEAGYEAFKSLIRRALRLTQNVKPFVDRFASPAIEPLPTPATEAGPRRRLSDLLYDERVPLTLRQMLASFVRMWIAAMAIGRAEERGEKVAPWLALALAEAFAQPSEALGETIERDLPTLLAAFVADANDRARLNSAATHWADEAAKSGEAVFFPLGGHAEDR